MYKGPSGEYNTRYTKTPRNPLWYYGESAYQHGSTGIRQNLCDVDGGFN